jgi:RNA polymerase sigma factor (sigma-70 family)
VNAVTDADIARYEPACRAVARSFWDTPDYDDILQEARMLVFKALSRYDPTKGTSKLTFVYSYLKPCRACYLRDEQGLLHLPRWRYERGERIRQPISLDLPVTGNEGEVCTLKDLLLDPAAEITPDLIYLHSTLEVLPPLLRRAAELCWLGSLTCEEAGRLEHRTPAAINNRLKRARKLVRERL